MNRNDGYGFYISYSNENEISGNIANEESTGKKNK